MLINNFDLKKITPSVVRCEWTATDTAKTCWFFRNGELIDTIHDTSSLNRAIEFSIEEGSSSVIDIHEVDGDEDVRTINSSRKTYNLEWHRFDDAVYYLIYHSVGNESESILTRLSQNPSTVKYVYKAPKLEWLDGVWHHFRVESVDKWGNESVRRLWHYFVYDMPSFPDTIEVSGSGGIFKVEIAF